MTEVLLMGEEELRRTLARLAHEIIESNPGNGDLVFVGMRTRGVPLAQRLAANLARFEDIHVPVGSLDIGLYRDDISLHSTRLALGSTDIPTSIDGKNIVLVDDVLFTGRSIRAALDALIDLGRPKRIQLVVLVDRGHRELPIRADFVGKNAPTALNEEIQVNLKETDGFDSIVLRRTP